MDTFMLRNIKKPVLLWGKIRRFYYSLLRSYYIKKQLLKRKGTCIRCGACCSLAFLCPYLSSKDGMQSCKVYNYRAGNCRVFPMNHADLKERDLILPGTKCGYSFDYK